MIGLDTNVLARYYIEDLADAEAEKQHQAALRLIEAGNPLMVCTTVLLEFEWVMRGYYGFKREDINAVFGHLRSLPHVHFEKREALEKALDHYSDGIDFADALHHVSYRNCQGVATFDDRKFARRAKRAGMSPAVFIPK